MPEISKTARASQVKEVKEKHVETIEQAIAALRLEREAHLWPNTERIDKLLFAYDAVKTEALLVPGLQASLKLKEDALIVLGEENKKLQQQLKRIADAGPVLNAQIDAWTAGEPTADAEPVSEHQHELDRMADEGCPHA